jgi:hypothetical protein
MAEKKSNILKFNSWKDKLSFHFISNYEKIVLFSFLTVSFTSLFAQVIPIGNNM